MSKSTADALAETVRVDGPAELPRRELVAWTVVLVVFGLFDLTTTHLALTATPLEEGNALASYVLATHGFGMLVVLKFVGLWVLFALYWVSGFRFVPYFLAVFGVAVVLNNAYRITVVTPDYTMWEATVGHLLTVLSALV